MIVVDPGVDDGDADAGAVIARGAFGIGLPDEGAALREGRPMLPIRVDRLDVGGGGQLLHALTVHRAGKEREDLELPVDPEAGSVAPHPTGKLSDGAAALAPVPRPGLGE